jgi:chromatin segregation and condensation protein Rec8/ScpA/Scc1 (kleisin family)
MDRNKLVKRFVIGTFITLYALVSVISTIHVIDFFELSNPYWLAVTLAIGFEIGAAASLASLVILKKMNKTLVWALFITITLMQMQGNMYYAFINLEDFGSWAELFDLIDEDIIDQKRILAFVSGAILPLIALGFIKSLVDYIKPEDEDEEWDDEIPEDSMLNDIERNLEEDVEEMYDAYVDRHAPDPIDEGEFFAAHDNGFDEEHALDLVLNDMVDDLTDEELDDIFEEDLDLLEAEEELDKAEEELDKAEEELEELSDKFEVENTAGDVEVIKVNRSNPPSATDGMTQAEIEAWQTLHRKGEEDLLKKALDDKANSDMKDYIKKDSDANNKS